jgi:uncharacterized protein (TIGR00255 family)
VEDIDAVWERCRPVLEKALADFTGMREKEGASIAADVRHHLAKLSEHRGAIHAAAPDAMKAGIQRFKERVHKLLQDLSTNHTLNNDVIEREIVLATDRTDVSEELARLESHFHQMEETILEGGESGKKLDFLTQELFRETNTIGSKVNDERVTHRVVEMKGLIERIREQVQNLE